jgi:succinyl-CoA synthetase beta subunit
MLLLEQDAKELLAIQGIPVPGAIRLAQIPAVGEAEDDSRSGPWIVKPQMLAAPAAGATSAVVARTNAEVAAAAAALLNQTVSGQVVHSVLVERQMALRGTAYLSFRCDPGAAGIRIDLGAGSGPRRSDVAAPDPTAVIACVNRLSAALGGEAQACVAEAGRLLAPLYFGYEAALLEIDPLTILADGSWVVGDVQMAIDENALFRHPELISLVERRSYAYSDVRQTRAHGIDHRILDPEGAVATIVVGAGHCAHLLDTLNARGLTPYNFMDAGRAALDGAPERLIAALDLLDDASSLRCVLLSAGDGVVDLAAFAAQAAAALQARPGFALPLVAHFVGTGAGAAGAILQQAYRPALIEPEIGAALDAVGRAVRGPG